MTNGELFTTIFPEARVSRNGFIVECSLTAFSFSVEESWWDAEYSKHTKGEWIFKGDCQECSECGAWMENHVPRNFCPSCGADMRGGSE